MWGALDTKASVLSGGVGDRDDGVRDPPPQLRGQGGTTDPPGDFSPGQRGGRGAKAPGVG